MNPRHFSKDKAQRASGLDDPSLAEPVDLSTVSPADLGDHEGSPVMLTSELLALVSDKPCDTPEDCDQIEKSLEDYYRLEATGFGITWDVRDRSARLVKL